MLLKALNLNISTFVALAYNVQGFMKRGVCAKYFPPRYIKPVLHDVVFFRNGKHGLQIRTNTKIKL